LNIGKVKLEAVIFGLCCACDAAVPANANPQTVARVARPRREYFIMEPLPFIVCLEQMTWIRS
jgi:hypothetical protein